MYAGPVSWVSNINIGCEFIIGADRRRENRTS